MAERIFKTGFGRVFLQSGGAGPGHVTQYLGLARLGGYSESLGDLTPVRIPSQTAYNRFDTIDTVQGEEGLPTTSLIALMTLVNPILSQLCPFDLSVHYGSCKDPTDYNGGWDKILHFEKSQFTNRSTDDLSALDSGERAPIQLTGDVTGRKFWEVDPITLAEKAGTEVTLEVIDVQVADFIACGECGYESDGNKRIFVLARGPSAGSPNLSSELLLSTDAGQTWTQYDIDTLTAGNLPSGLEVQSPYAIVIGVTDLSMQYALLTDLDAWTANAGNFAQAPNDIWGHSVSQIWVCCEGGYIYFFDVPTESIADAEIQSDGTVTAQGLNSIHGADGRNVLCGGDSGALVVTNNGGATWALSPTTPTADNILTVWMRTPFSWLIGDDAGALYYTNDAGDTWTQIVFTTATPSSVFGISFADHSDSPFGYMVASLAEGAGDKGYIFRTIDGGQSWIQMPGETGTTPDNDRLTAVSTGLSANFVVAGGLGTGAVDGIVIVGAGGATA